MTPRDPDPGDVDPRDVDPGDLDLGDLDPLDRVRQLLSSVAGLRLDGSRRDGLLRTVQERVLALGLTGPEDYLRRLDVDPDELAALLAQVTVPETHFFRNPPQIEALRHHVLPQLAARALREGRPLRIWSAGCATGEEPYTLAILVREAMATLPGGAALQTEVIGTDISRTALAAADRARYGARSLALAGAAERERWFVRDGAVLSPVPEVTSMVRLLRHNLAADPAPFPPGVAVDLVLCRNVTIYLEREVTRELISRLHGVLGDGGYLFLGHSETLWQVNDQFQLVTLGDAFVYRRDDAPGQPPRPEPGTQPPRSVLSPAQVERRQGARRFADRLRRRDEPSADRQVAGGPAADRQSARHERRAWPGPPPPGSLQDQLALAWTALSGDAPERALTLATEVASALPMLSAGHHLRGLALTRLQRPTEALVALRAAAYADPDDGLVQLALATAQQQLGQSRAARVSWRNAAQMLLARPPAADHPAVGSQGVEGLVGYCRSRTGAVSAVLP